MKFLVRRFFSGFCTFEIEAENEEKAYEISQKLSINEDEILATLEEWREANELEAKNN